MRRNTRLVQRQGTLCTGKWPFALDVVACPRCGGRLRMIATVEDPVAVRQILAARRPAEPLGPGPPAPPGPRIAH